MEFGILFTSHPHPASEPYPHREVHARVTAEIQAADRLGYRYRLGGRASLLEPVRDHARRVHVPGLPGRQDVAHPARHRGGHGAALRARARGGESGLRRHPVGRTRHDRPGVGLSALRVRRLRAGFRGPPRPAGRGDRAHPGAPAHAAHHASGAVLPRDDCGRVRSVPGQCPAAPPAALHGRAARTARWRMRRATASASCSPRCRPSRRSRGRSASTGSTCRRPAAPLDQNPACGNVDVARWVYVAETDAAAKRDTEAGIVRHLRALHDLGDGSGYLGNVSEQKSRVEHHLNYDTLAATTLMHGSPETVITRLHALRDQTGLTSLLLHYPPWYGTERAKASLELFAREVIPCVRRPRRVRNRPASPTRRCTPGFDLPERMMSLAEIADLEWLRSSRPAGSRCRCRTSCAPHLHESPTSRGREASPLPKNARRRRRGADGTPSLGDFVVPRCRQAQVAKIVGAISTMSTPSTAMISSAFSTATQLSNCTTRCRGIERARSPPPPGNCDTRWRGGPPARRLPSGAYSLRRPRRGRPRPGARWARRCRAPRRRVRAHVLGRIGRHAHERCRPISRPAMQTCPVASRVRLECSRST